MNQENKTNNILIVEDELLIAENLAMKLKTMKYHVIGIVSSGNAAIKKVEEQNPDLILMDIAIKGDLDGIETAVKIRAVYDIPIIFLTAYADEKTLERASQTGCYGYMLKPYKDLELQATIKIALNKYREQNIIQQSLETKIEQYASKSGPINIDSITKLPNHLALLDIFEFILSQGEEQEYHEENQLGELKQQSDSNKVEQSTLAVLYFEIDRFQRIFESLDQESHDLLLINIAEYIIEALAGYDLASATIKLKNSEFVILVAGIEQQQEAEDIANKILNQFRHLFVVKDLEFFLTATIGIAFYPVDDTNIHQLLKQAQQALYYGQEKGGDRCKIYSKSLQLISSIAADKLFLETDLHHALERQELELYYQPKIELKTGKIIGAEALVRWNHPQLGLLISSQFMPLAEQSSLTESIEQWILATACKQTLVWHQSGAENFRIAVNLSARQFKQLDLFHQLTEIFTISGFPPELLELELTEKIFVDNEKLNIQRLNLIKKLNLKLALDNFGTGHSSLSYLQQFPFDILKIDRSFIRQIKQNTKKAVITTSLIQMAHQLGLQVVAVGVETKSELAFLQDAQCDQVQGYCFSRPLPVKEFERLLSQKLPWYTKNQERLTIKS